MKITYYGHSCFAMEVKGKQLLFDPYITANSLAKNIDINKIPADYVLLSHGHNDHIADAEAILKRTGAMLIAPNEVAHWFHDKKGIEKFHPMNIGGHWFFDFGKVKCVVAVHSSTMPDGSSGGSPLGFLIESDMNFYYAGDTALTYDMKLIGEYKKISLAFLPIGSNYTMGVDNAIIASDFIRCDRIIGMHYNTFEDIKIDQDKAKRKFSNAGKELILMNIGETINLN